MRRLYFPTALVLLYYPQTGRQFPSYRLTNSSSEGQPTRATPRRLSPDEDRDPRCRLYEDQRQAIKGLLLCSSSKPKVGFPAHLKRPDSPLISNYARKRHCLWWRRIPLILTKEILVGRHSSIRELLRESAVAVLTVRVLHRGQTNGCNYPLEANLVHISSRPPH